MSTLKTNTISTNDANNVALSNQLNLKSYTTTARDALTSVAGDMIYNTTDSKVQVHTGSAWEDLGDRAIDIDFLVIAGGASGYHSYGGGGGAGGFRASWNNETSGGGASSETAYILVGSQSYTVTVGGGGSGSDKYSSASGGAGVVIIKYPDTYTLGGGTGLTIVTPSSPPSGYTLKVFTSGTGTITFS